MLQKFVSRALAHFSTVEQWISAHPQADHQSAALVSQVQALEKEKQTLTLEITALKEENSQLKAKIESAAKTDAEIAAKVEEVANLKALEITQQVGVAPVVEEVVQQPKTSAEIWAEYRSLKTQQERSAFYRKHRKSLWG